MPCERKPAGLESRRASMISYPEKQGPERKYRGSIAAVLGAAVVFFSVPFLAAAEPATDDGNKISGGSIASRKSVPAPAGNKKYMGKDYIDSTIVRAIFVISDAASVAGIGFKQKEGIEEARRIAKRLRLESKGDPNERYAQWKIRELEWLVHLEEKDLVIQKMKENEADINKLIADYNTEVGKRRPDFKALLWFESRMAELAPDRANEMGRYIKKRSESISGEAMTAVEKALMSNNEPAASEEFRYCLRNRPYFGYSNSKFEDVEGRVSACARSRDELPVVKSELDKALSLLDRNRVGEARSQIAFAEYRFTEIKPFIPPREIADIGPRFDRCTSKLNKIEDSLVAVNVEILRTRGVEAANRYLQSVLREVGVCREKASHVDQAILSVVSPEKSNAMQKEIEAVAYSTDEKGGDILTDMRIQAMVKAQRKLDSLAALGEIVQNTDSNKRMAQEIIVTIYRMVEQKNIRDAVRRFDQEKAFLRSAVEKDIYDMLAATLTQASQSER